MDYYDYMLLELAQDLTYSPSIWAIQLAEDDTIKQGVVGTISGFGFTSQVDSGGPFMVNGKLVV